MYFLGLSDQIDETSAAYKIFFQRITLSFRLQSDLAFTSPSCVSIVDVFKQGVSGFSVSRRFEASVLESAVVLQEAPENKLKDAPADLDSLLQGTFRMGFKQSEAIRKGAIDLPHFDVIRQAEAALAKEREDPAMVDEEGGMDDEDDMDV